MLFDLLIIIFLNDGSTVEYIHNQKHASMDECILASFDIGDQFAQDILSIENVIDVKAACEPSGSKSA